MNDAVEMTANQFQQNISIKLADDYLSTLLTGNVMEIPVDLTIIFNSVMVFKYFVLLIHCHLKHRYMYWFMKKVVTTLFRNYQSLHVMINFMMLCSYE